MKYMLEGIESARLRFRLLEDDDFTAWLPLMGDEAACRFLALTHLETARERCMFWFDKCRERYASDRGGLNVLVEKASGLMVGQCGLLIQEVDGVEELEIGYSLLPEHRRQGYAIEAARTCRDFAFENRLAESLISIIHVENSASRQVALKNGMTPEKRSTFTGNPVEVYRITRDGWLHLRKG